MITTSLRAALCGLIVTVSLNAFAADSNSDQAVGVAVNSGQPSLGNAPAGPPQVGGWQPGGYEARIGSPYYYSVQPRYGHSHYQAAAGSAPQYHQAPQYGHAHGYSQGDSHGFGRDPYSYHFGPGYLRHSEFGHYRFPYYSYRRPWYFPGHPVYNRDTNFPW